MKTVDVLGFSMGGMVAQEFVLANPDLVRRVILAGTAPAGGENLGFTPDVTRAATNPVNTREDFLYLFFGPSATSQAAGKAFWERRHQRTKDVDPPVSGQAIQVMIAAGADWAEIKGERYARLAEIKQPVLVVNGKHDIMLPTINSYILQQHLPNAQLILYPDSGHAAQFQFPELFLAHSRLFLDS